jgi:hypothetical protein
VSIEFIAEPADTAWHPQAAEILTLMVEAACLRGLNEDYGEARVKDSVVELRLMETRPVVDQQNPARNAFKSSISESRYRRRG